MFVKTVVVLALVGAAVPSLSAEMRSFKTTAEVVKLAESIPVRLPAAGTTNVAQRMQLAGISITGGRKYSYDSKAELEDPTDRVGDVHFTIHGTQPSEAFKRRTCDMWGDASFLKRAGNYYPESRAANWLMNGDCSTNFAKPGR